MSVPTITLDQISADQGNKEVTFNEIAAAMSARVLFGVKQRATNGLRLTLYGGSFDSDTGRVKLPDQTVTLTPSVTNYVYANVAGTVVKTTTAPDGWPGPMPTGATALYQLTVGANAITSGTCYILGTGVPGVKGQVGAVGAAGAELWQQRYRWATAIGGGATGIHEVGFTMAFTGASASARTLASTTLRESICYTTVGNGPTAGLTGTRYSNVNFCYRGNAAGRGGFTVSFRFCFESSFTSTTARRFVGLYNIGTGIPGDVEADTFVDCIGVGSNSGETTLSLIHNDASGTATKTTLYSDGSPTQTFPARSTNNVYELQLTAAANASSVDYVLTNCNTGDVASGSISSDLPSSTTFLGWLFWSAVGSSAGTTLIGFMQVTADTRY